MSIHKKVVSGAKWSFTANITKAIIALIRIAIMTRFLSRYEFGLVAIINVFLGFTSLFQDLGITSAIIHKKNITQNEYDSLYWLNIIFGFFLFVLAFSATPFLAKFYEHKELLIITPIMASSLFFSSIGRQHRTIAIKQLNFKLISIIEISTQIISLIIAILLVITREDVYALVFSIVVQQVVLSVLYLLSGLRYRKIYFHFVYKETIPFLRIGLYQVGSQVLNFFNGKLDVLIVGKVLGAEKLGIYDLAKGLASKPQQFINPVVNTIAAPVLSYNQEDNAKLADNFLKVIDILSLINIPIYILLSVLAEPAVRILYGTDYMDCVDIVRIYAIYMLLRSLNNPVGGLVIAMGRTELEFKWNILLFLIFPIVVITGAKISLLVLCYLLVGIMLVLYIPNWYLLVYKLSYVKLRDYFLATLPYLVLSGISAFIVYTILNQLEKGYFIELTFGVIIFFIIYVILLFIFMKKKVKYLIRRVLTR